MGHADPPLAIHLHICQGATDKKLGRGWEQANQGCKLEKTKDKPCCFQASTMYIGIILLAFATHSLSLSGS